MARVPIARSSTRFIGMKIQIAKSPRPGRWVVREAAGEGFVALAPRRDSRPPRSEGPRARRTQVTHQVRQRTASRPSQAMSGAIAGGFAQLELTRFRGHLCRS